MKFVSKIISRPFRPRRISRSSPTLSLSLSRLLQDHWHAPGHLPTRRRQDRPQPISRSHRNRSQTNRASLQVAQRGAEGVQRAHRHASRFSLLPGGDRGGNTGAAGRQSVGHTWSCTTYVPCRCCSPQCERVIVRTYIRSLVRWGSRRTVTKRAALPPPPLPASSFHLAHPIRTEARRADVLMCRFTVAHPPERLLFVATVLQVATARRRSPRPSASPRRTRSNLLLLIIIVVAAVSPRATASSLRPIPGKGPDMRREPCVESEVQCSAS